MNHPSEPPTLVGKTADKIRYLSWSACDKIDKLIELIADDDTGTWNEVHAAINRVRSHLEARACQTATPLVIPVCATPLGMPEYTGLLPVVPMLAPDLAVGDEPTVEDFSDLLGGAA